MTEQDATSAGGNARAERVRQVVLECYRRRAAGESISDASLIEAHPELMPELAKELTNLRVIEVAQARAETDETITQDTTRTDQLGSFGGLQIRCPHCHSSVEIDDDTPFADITCTDCGSQFSLIGEETETRAAESVRMVGHFELLERLGLGAFGTVWKARDAQLDRTVAVKIPRKGQLQPAEVEQFLREARTAAQLNHPNIVGIHEVGRDGNTVYIVTDLVRGVPLSDWLTGQRLTVREAAELCRKVAAALHHAHEMGVVHRDLKPQNIMIDADGQPQLMDFGLARREAGDVTMTLDGQVLGTPAYMSPEQAQGEAHRADRRSDVYSLGVILFELLTGELPFRGNVRMLIHQVIHEQAPSPRKLNGNVPRDLETICVKCLEKDRRKRYGSAQKLADELRRFSRGKAIEARPIGPLARSWRWCRRYPAVSGLAMGLLVVLLAGLAGVTGQWIRADHERDIANRHLYESLVGQARALRLARVNGYRRQAWDRLQQARTVDTPILDLEELRQEAVACMGDFVGLAPVVWNDFASEIVTIAVRPGARELAIGLKDGSVLLRDLAQGTETTRLSVSASQVTALSFNADGNVLVTGDQKGNVGVWEARGAGDWFRTKNYTLQEGGVDTAAFTPDGQRLLVSHNNGSSVTTALLLDEADDVICVELPIPGDVHDTRGMTFHPDGTLLATRWDQNGRWEIAIWDVADRRIVKTIRPELGIIKAVTYSRDGNLLVCGGNLGVRIYDTDQYEAITYVRGDAVESVALNRHNELVANSSWHLGSIRLWSVSANREVAVLSHPDMLRRSPQIAFDEDGKVLVSTTPQTVRLWQLAGADARLPTEGHTGGVCGVTYSPDGTLMASASKDRTVKIWDAATGDLAHEIGDFEGQVQTVAFSPDGHRLATGDWAGNVQIWDTRAWKQLDVVKHELHPRIWFVAFSPNGDYFAIGGVGGVKVWRIPVDGPGSSWTLEELAQPTTNSISTLRFSPNSQLLTWYRRYGAKTVHVWDVVKAVEVFVSPPDVAPLTQNIAFCPDSKRLMLVNADGIIERWNITTRQRECRFENAVSADKPTVRLDGHVTLSKDGHWCASHTGVSVLIWDTHTKKLLLTLPKERSAVWSTAWNPDGNSLAVGTSTGELVIWSIPKIREQLADLGLDW